MLLEMQESWNVTMNIFISWTGCHAFYRTSVVKYSTMNHIKQAFISHQTDEKQACFNGKGFNVMVQKLAVVRGRKSSLVSGVLLGIDHAIFPSKQGTVRPLVEVVWLLYSWSCPTRTEDATHLVMESNLCRTISWWWCLLMCRRSNH